MERHGFDLKVPDFIWNKNRLVLEKEALKQNMLRALQKPVNNTKKDSPDEEDQGKMQNWSYIYIWPHFRKRCECALKINLPQLIMNIK